MPINPRIMPFTKHFIELRRRFIYVLIAFVLCLMVFYQDFFYQHIMNILLGPIKAYIPGGQLTVLGPFETLTFRFKMAMYAAAIASSPVILYNIFAFIMPAIKRKERKWLVPTVLAAVLLFLTGVAFAYFVIMGPAFEWLYQQGAGVIGSIASANLYLSGIAMMLIGFGIAFELPLVVFYLIGWGVLPYDTVVKSWRFAIVIIMIVAAIATPDWSPINMGGLSLALIILYFGALVAARVVFSKKIAEQRVEKAAYDAMYAEPDLDEQQQNVDRFLPADFAELSRTDQMIARAQAQQKAAAIK